MRVLDATPVVSAAATVTVKETAFSVVSAPPLVPPLRNETVKVAEPAVEAWPSLKVHLARVKVPDEVAVN
jgi:hypothetical protein